MSHETTLSIFEAITSGDYDYARLRCRSVYSVQDFAYHCRGIKMNYDKAERVSEIATAKLILMRLMDETNDEVFLPAIQRLRKMVEDGEA